MGRGSGLDLRFRVYLVLRVCFRVLGFRVQGLGGSEGFGQSRV